MKWGKHFKSNTNGEIKTVYLKVKDVKAGSKTMNSDSLAQKHTLVHIKMAEKRDNNKQELLTLPLY